MCQSMAQVCLAILQFTRDPQVIDQALTCLNEALKSKYHSKIKW
jgi:hypothetical protein